ADGEHGADGNAAADAIASDGVGRGGKLSIVMKENLQDHEERSGAERKSGFQCEADSGEKKGGEAAGRFSFGVVGDIGKDGPDEGNGWSIDDRAEDCEEEHSGDVGRTEQVEGKCVEG